MNYPEDYINKIIQGNCLEVMKDIPDNSIDAICCDPPYGISFMGKKWDYDVPKVEVWIEAMRVLKAGGHILVACGTRTQHRMCVNIEDGGFEIRDIVAWIYGSGFPKSLNIGKAVDKLQGNDRDEVGKNPNHRKLQETNTMVGEPHSGNGKLTKGNSPYEGWGTALKPAMELWTLARKPLEEKTVAKNVLKYGTGGINIDGCRVEYQSKSDMEIRKNTHREVNKLGDGNFGGGKYSQPVEQGRFPANCIHDGSEEVVSKFPDTGKSNITFRGSEEREKRINLDSGFASRFFYCAKASKSERNKGLDGFEEKGKVFNGQSDKPSVDVKDVEERFNTKPTANHHPTVKPIALMRYLVKLITPKGGTVLDPFMGSGSTGIACKEEGFNFIGIDLEKEYCDIAEARINGIEDKLI